MRPPAWPPEPWRLPRADRGLGAQEGRRVHARVVVSTKRVRSSAFGSPLKRAWICGRGCNGRARHHRTALLIDVERGGLVRVLPERDLGSVEITAPYPSRRSLSAKVRVFLDALVAHFSDNGPDAFFSA